LNAENLENQKKQWRFHHYAADRETMGFGSFVRWIVLSSFSATDEATSEATKGQTQRTRHFREPS